MSRVNRRKNSEDANGEPSQELDDVSQTTAEQGPSERDDSTSNPKESAPLSKLTRRLLWLVPLLVTVLYFTLLFAEKISH